MTTIEKAARALAFYANEDLYSSLSYAEGPGTLPLLAADKGQIARDAIAQMEAEACPQGAKSMPKHSISREDRQAVLSSLLPPDEGMVEKVARLIAEDVVDGWGPFAEDAPETAYEDAIAQQLPFFRSLASNIITAALQHIMDKGGE